MSEFSKSTQEREYSLRVSTLLKMLGYTALYSCGQVINRVIPPSPPLFKLVEESVADRPQPIHPDIETTVRRIQSVINSRPSISLEQPSLSSKLARSTQLVQFTDRLGGSEQSFIHYDSIKRLKDKFITVASEQEYPLSFDQQFEVALDLNENRVLPALESLWIGSRQYARWFDSSAMFDLPDMASQEILHEMTEWRSSVLACKNADEENFQDTSGDTYYAWTHAYATVLHGSGSSPSDKIGKYVFQRGTKIDSRIRVFEQDIPSNHSVAAEFGNRIGDAILEFAPSNYRH